MQKTSTAKSLEMRDSGDCHDDDDGDGDDDGDCHDYDGDDDGDVMAYQLRKVVRDALLAKFPRRKFQGCL